MNHYHHIFTGGGLATLMTLSEMVKQNLVKDKTILVIEKEEKNSNDRTWCYWDSTSSYNEIIHKKWTKTWFICPNKKIEMKLAPYQYKMIRSSQFYELLINDLKKHPNIIFIKDEVVDFHEMGEYCLVKTKTNTYTTNQIFNSIYNPSWINKQNKYPLIQQHFLGWIVQTKEAVFTPDCPTFMDFSIPQKHHTRFMYVLPFSEHNALVEYTLFSKNLLRKDEYEIAIKDYLKEIGVSEYEIIEKEYGNIPMTCYPFWKKNTKNIIHIGSAGGWTKASTGFTFKNSTKKSKELIEFIQHHDDFRKWGKKNKFWFYDVLLIDILYRYNHLGGSLFTSIFKNGNATLIFKFLDEETSIFEDLLVIWKCPKIIFIKALSKRVLNKINLFK